MNIITAPSETLPTLIDRAVSALENARTSAEILEAREMARVAYDAAKSALRIARAKTAHDSIIAEVHRAQANASFIRARAEMRLAEEYDAAQARGEVAIGSVRTDIVGNDNDVRPATAAEVGLRRDEIHEARKLLYAEKADPGITRRALDNLEDRGDEPTRAAMIREINRISNGDRPEPQKVMNPLALWIWGRLKDFEREGVLNQDPSALLSEMTEPMRADVRRLLPKVRAFIEDMESKA